MLQNFCIRKPYINFYFYYQMLDSMGLGHQMATVREYMADVIVPHHTQILEVFEPELPAAGGQEPIELVAALGNLRVVCISASS